MDTIVLKARNYYQNNGLLKLLKHSFEKLGFVCFEHSLIFLRLDLTKISNDFSHACGIHIASTDDVREGKDYLDGWFNKQDSIDHIQCGHRLFVLRENERAVCHIWVELRMATIAYFDMRINIPRDIAYLTGVYTAPEFRNRGIYSKCLREVIHYLKKEGFNLIFCVIDPKNKTSLNVTKKSGFEECQIVNYRRYWHIRYFHVKKSNSSQEKKFITLFKSPNTLWKTF